jgi:hypothetical protein
MPFLAPCYMFWPQYEQLQLVVIDEISYVGVRMLIVINN